MKLCAIVSFVVMISAAHFYIGVTAFFLMALAVSILGYDKGF